MNSIKELVKKHFGLIEKQSFMTINTADGALTLEYDGEMLSEGLAIFVKTNDGNIPAPDGELALEGGITITTKDGKIESIMETTMAVADVVEEKMAEETPEEVVADVVEEVISEEVIKAVTEAVSDVVGEMMKKMEETMAKQNEKMTALESKFNSFSSAPAAEKTIVGHPSTRSEFSKSLNQDLVDKFIAIKNQKSNN